MVANAIVLSPGLLVAIRETLYVPGRAKVWTGDVAVVEADPSPNDQT
jgi:hypothetical protein